MPKPRMCSHLIFVMVATSWLIPISTGFTTTCIYPRLLNKATLPSLTGALAPKMVAAPTASIPLRAAKITRRFASEGTGESEAASDEDPEKKRMEMVRSLQQTFYRSTSDGTADSPETASQRRACLDESTGIVTDLSLWRVGWVETPGRSNVLNVHEGKYTHMFETMLSGPEPWYFGHLHLPGGTRSVNSGSERYQLRNWKEELSDERRFDDEGGARVGDRSAVVGCLMQIIDHRRMEDGRLMLFVHALERFVVEDVVQENPYSVANAQIVLDSEDLIVSGKDSVNEDSPDSGSNGKGSSMKMDENFFQSVRARAVTASFHYHGYEFDKKKLPVPGEDDYLSPESVPWVGISKLLPFAYYSMDDASLDAANKKTALIGDTPTGTFAGGSLPMEQQIRNGGILWDPSPLSGVVVREEADCDALETLLWLALDDFCRATGFVIPEEVLCLMPPAMDYLDIDPPERRLSPTYPAIRRQRRLSYHAPALIENLNVGKNMRQILLNTPSTKARLHAVLQRYEYLNNKLLGQFE